MTPLRIDVETVERTIGRAYFSDSYTPFSATGRRGLWDVSKDCESPVPVTMWSRSTGSVARRNGKVSAVAEITLLTACRGCRVCLAKKARLWRWRAEQECAASERTWFGTLTVSLQEHWEIDIRCRTIDGNFDLLPLAKKFDLQCRVLGKEVTKYLKRVRKNSGCPFRYLLVAEAHDSADTDPRLRGRPHMHLLLHEFSGMPIRKVKLEDAWHLGFPSFKLVSDDKRASWYVSKYISKSLAARCRASLKYGNHQSENDSF